MTLATVKQDGSPSARIVLLKGIQDEGFSFYTNYDSHKGIEMAQHKSVALVFCWLELQRQVRIEGTVERLPAEESDAYFASRPRNSQLGAHASNQSQLLKNRGELEQNYQIYHDLFLNKTVTRPDNWGGYLVKPNLIEFWQGRQSRLHDRFCYKKAGNTWKISRLAP
jgi:pyridoxamine 5'-phosphate oxidase